VNDCRDCVYSERTGFYRFKLRCKLFLELGGQPLLKRFEKSPPIVLKKDCSYFMKGVGQPNCLECIHLVKITEEHPIGLWYEYICERWNRKRTTDPGEELEHLVLHKHCSKFVRGKKYEDQVRCPKCFELHTNKEHNNYCERCVHEIKEMSAHLSKIKTPNKKKPKIGQRKIKPKK